jgi:hypothetical protein
MGTKGVEFLFHFAVLAAVLMFVVPAHLVPMLFIAGFFLWGVGLALDLRSTHGMYLASPDFAREERNPFFRRLAPRLGFARAALVFFAAVELSVLSLVAFALVRYVSVYFFGSYLPEACLGTAAATLGAAHLLAWRKNSAPIVPIKEKPQKTPSDKSK